MESPPPRGRLGGAPPDPDPQTDVVVEPTPASPDSGVAARGRFGAGLRDLCARIGVVQRGWGWLVWALAAGLLPLLVCWPLGSSAHQGISGFALTLLVWGAIYSGRNKVALASVILVFASHSALAIALSAAAPDQAAPLLSDGADYWAKQQAWIRTGHDPEYELSTWLPIHVQLLVACFVLAPLSLGLTIFARGFYEVDLMNFYVGNLLRESGGAWGAIAFGWHPWSLCRGLCYVLLTCELVRLSLHWLWRRDTSLGRGGRWRLGLALVFFVADCVIKSSCTESVRGVLHAALVR